MDDVMAYAVWRQHDVAELRQGPLPELRHRLADGILGLGADHDGVAGGLAARGQIAGRLSVSHGIDPDLRQARSKQAFLRLDRREGDGQAALRMEGENHSGGPAMRTIAR